MGWRTFSHPSARGSIVPADGRNTAFRRHRGARAITACSRGSLPGLPLAPFERSARYPECDRPSSAWLLRPSTAFGASGWLLAGSGAPGDFPPKSASPILEHW